MLVVFLADELCFSTCVLTCDWDRIASDSAALIVAETLAVPDTNVRCSVAVDDMGERERDEGRGGGMCVDFEAESTDGAEGAGEDAASSAGEGV